MRFCPKCSLKIKGTITQCPICKVELLSCAEDDEMDSRIPDNEQLPALEPEPAQQTLESIKPAPAADSSRMRDTAAATPPQQKDADPSSIITGKLARLEEHLKNIGKTLTLHMKKEEVLTRSLVELESKINKIEKSVMETVHAKSSSPATPEMTVTAADNGASQAGSAADSELQIPRSDKTSFALSGEGETSRRWASSRDITSSAVTDHEEDAGFFSESPDGFEESSETDTSLLYHGRFVHAGRERKKVLLIIIPVLCLLALFLVLVFYYNNLQKQTDQKLTITEQITLSSIPVETTESQAASAREAPAEAKPDITETPAASQAALPAVPDGNEEAVSNIAPQNNAVRSQGGFTVAVGSFKEKSNAIGLTARLNQKGYAAQMTQLKQKKLFRVTVGTFASRGEAIAMASRLNKSEKLQTAIIDLNKP